MKTQIIRVSRILLATLIICSTIIACKRVDSTLTIESLLNEMIDRDAVARYPQTDFRLKQQSSYNRASVSPEDEEAWFNNKDINRTENEHPFHAQPRGHVYDKLNRKTTNERNSLGYSTETRTRSLDGIPFGSSLQLDMEVWSWTDCDMAYAVGVYWYGDKNTKSIRKPDPEGVLVIPGF